MYNLTAISGNSTGLLGLTQGVNDVLMFGTLGIFFLLAFSIIVFTTVIYTSGSIQKASLATTFIAFTLSLFLMAMGLLPFFAMMLCLVAAAIAFGFSFLDR